MQGWVSKPGKVVIRDQLLSGGLNQFSGSPDIDSSQLLIAQNVDSLKLPAIQTRDGYYTSRDYSGEISRIFTFDNTAYMANQSGVYRIASDSINFVSLYANAIPIYESTSAEFIRWQVVPFPSKNRVVILRSPDQLYSYTGSTFSPINTAPIGRKYLELHANRFFMAGTNQSETASLLSYSGLRDETDWSSPDPYTGTGTINVDTSDDTVISGLVSFAGNLYVFKDTSMHILYGEDSTNFQLTKMFDIGCASDATIVKTTDALYWLALDGFYRYQPGGIPTKISDPVADFMDSGTYPFDQDSCAGWDGRFIYLSVSESSLRRNTLKFDTLSGTWWETTWKISAFFNSYDRLYAATPTGRVFVMGGTLDGTTPISWTAVTAPLKDGDETVRRTMNRLFVIADIDPGASLTVSYATGIEGEDWRPVYSNANGSGSPLSIRIPFIVHAPDHWFRIRFTGVGRSRIHRVSHETTRRGS